MLMSVGSGLQDGVAELIERDVLEYNGTERLSPFAELSREFVTIGPPVLEVPVPDGWRV